MLLASLAHTLIRAERSAEHLHQHLYGLRHGRFFKKSLDLFGDCLSVPAVLGCVGVCAVPHGLAAESQQGGEQRGVALLQSSCRSLLRSSC
jgi:hypothetical protein